MIFQLHTSGTLSSDSAQVFSATLLAARVGFLRVRLQQSCAAQPVPEPIPAKVPVVGRLAVVDAVHDGPAVDGRQQSQWMEWQIVVGVCVNTTGGAE